MSAAAVTAKPKLEKTRTLSQHDGECKRGRSKAKKHGLNYEGVNEGCKVTNACDFFCVGWPQNI